MDAVHCTTESPPILSSFQGVLFSAWGKDPRLIFPALFTSLTLFFYWSNKPHHLEYAAGQALSEEPDEEMGVQLPYWFVVEMLNLFSQDSHVTE